MFSAVRWEDLSPETFEDMCAVLVSRLHPESRRIDGTGGDGGADVLISMPEGPIVYEMKGFTGRFTAGRRTQTANSLKRASLHEPSMWILIVPIDPTPVELKWFESLARDYPFECRWYGRTWLDSQMASHPDIVRYYLQGASDEVASILRDLSRETRALERGAPDALDRVQALSQRLNALDPHYAFGLSADEDGGTAVTVWPKYAGAELDRPIKIDSVFRFSDDNEGRSATAAFQESMSYGAPIKRLDFRLPGGLAQSLERGDFSFDQARREKSQPISLSMRIIDANGHTRAQLPLSGVLKNRGMRGADFSLTDPSGAIKATLRQNVDHATSSFEMKYEMPQGVLPSAMIPALVFMENYRPPNSIVMMVGAKEAGLATAIEVDPGTDVSPLLFVVRSLDEIQRKTGVYFPFPSHLSRNDLENIDFAAQLLAGKPVKGKWTALSMSSTAGALPSLKANLRRGPQQLMTEAELSVLISGHEVPLGFTRRIMPSAVVTEWPSPSEGSDPDAPVLVVFKPGEDDSVTTSLATRNDLLIERIDTLDVA